MIERFRLGYTPADRYFMHKFLKQKGYSDDFLSKSGLFLTNYKSTCLFSGRLMFPIADRQGRVVAFGGRALPGVLQSDGKVPPKYINSPEIEIYKKRQTLYGIDLALPEIRRTKTAYIAEGYLDVIALHQAGITNAVAPLGTAFTDEQAKLLNRWAERIILVFDSDEAGQKAAYKSIIICRRNGLSCAVSQPEYALKQELSDYGIYKDPADILQKFGALLLNKILKYVINDFEYLISCGRTSYNISTPAGKNQALAFLFPYLETLDSEVERDDCITAAADAYGVDRSAVHRDYLKRKKKENSFGEEKRDSSLQNRQIRMNGELFLLTVISVNMELYPEFRTALEIKEIDDPAAKELFIALEECFLHEESGIDSLLTRIKDEPLRNFIAGRGTSPEFKGKVTNGLTGSFAGNFATDPRRLMEDGIKGIRKKRLRQRLTEIGAQMRMNERSEDGEINVDELVAEKMFIDSQLRKLEGR
jgi:DNA primase